MVIKIDIGAFINWVLVKLRLRAAAIEHKLEDAVSQLNESLNKLKLVSEAKAAEEIVQREFSKVALEAAELAKEEAERAKRIAGNIAGLLS